MTELRGDSPTELPRACHVALIHFPICGVNMENVVAIMTIAQLGMLTLGMCVCVNNPNDGACEDATQGRQRCMPN